MTKKASDPFFVRSSPDKAIDINSLSAEKVSDTFFPAG